MGESGKLFDREEIIAHQATEDFLKEFMEEFEKWVAPHLGYR
ncbi:hypothetical protein [Chryseobacterium hagamense]|nr:hypothetical protein [Chryseobacterium hagamense]